MTRVVVAEDSVLLREGIVRLLEERGFNVVGQAGDADDLMRKVSAHKPDVAVIDIRMPPTHTDDGVKAAREIGRRHPETAVLVLSQYVDHDYACESSARERAAWAICSGTGSPRSSRSRMRSAGRRGGSALDPEVLEQLVAAREDDPLEGLSRRERDVLGLMAEGRSNRAIAEKLVVTERAVEKHVTRIFNKLGLDPGPETHRRVLAVLAWLRSR